MKQRILVLSGKKQSGKSSTARFVAGTELRNQGVIKYRDMDSLGNLEVNSVIENEKGEKEELMCRFDIDMNIYQQDEDFMTYMYGVVYPHVKIYAIADPLKEFLVEVFEIKPEQVYGTEHQKNSNTKYIWEDFRFLLPKGMVTELKEKDAMEKRMSARDIMEVFGTKVCRRIHGDCWLNATKKRIKEENCPLAIITDARFPNEIEAFKNMGATTLRLERNPYDSDSEPEVALDKYKDFDITIHNEHMTMVEKNQKLMDELYGCGFFPVEMGV